MFELTTSPIATRLDDFSSNEDGAVVIFEGRVRKQHQGREVKALEYEVYPELAQKEGEKILEEASERFPLHHMKVIHRVGLLDLNEVAILIAVSAAHRDEAFKACRYIIDEIKHRLPIWKKEHYFQFEPEWVFCRDHHHHVHLEEKSYYAKQAPIVNQNILSQSRILLVGIGGLGSQVLTNLAQAGVGFMCLVDDDTIHESNLHRQFLYRTNILGEKKVLYAAQFVRDLNPFIKLETHDDYFRPEMVSDIDLVIDCTDNLRTKYLIHDTCFIKKIPLVTASLYQSQGVLATYNFSQGCLHCFQEERSFDSLLGNCNDAGVLGASVSFIGSMQALEVLEYLQHKANQSVNHKLLIDTKSFEISRLELLKDLHCSWCSQKNHSLPLHLELTSHELRPGDVVLDIRHLTFNECLDQTQHQGRVVLSCHRGNKSYEWASKLRDQGINHVYSLRGGQCSH